MDQMMVDVTGIEGVCRGEEAILFGGDATGSIPVTELAARCGTIPYETVCLIGRRVPRVYLRQGGGDWRCRLYPSPAIEAAGGMALASHCNRSK